MPKEYTDSMRIEHLNLLMHRLISAVQELGNRIEPGLGTKLADDIIKVTTLDSD